MGSNPKGAELRKCVSICQRSAQGALAPQRPPAQQADPLTAHQSNPEYLQIESTLWIGKAVCTLLEFLLVCLHAVLEFLSVLGSR